MRLMLWLFLLGVIGCASAEPEGESSAGSPPPEASAEPADPVEPSRPEGGPESPPRSDPWARYQAAREDAAAGRWDLALRSAEALLADPQLPAELLTRTQALESAARGEVLRREGVVVQVLLDARRVALGTPITGRLVVQNRCQETLEIPVFDPSGRQTFVYLELDYEEFDILGDMVRERRTYPVSIPEDIRLEPGEQAELPVTLDTLQIGPTRTNYRRYRINGSVFPADLRVGDRSWTGRVAIHGDACDVMPRNYEPLLDSPLSQLRVALAKNSPPHVPIAAVLAAEGDRAATLEVLVTALKQDWSLDPDGPTRVASCVALRILTGEDLPARPDAWVAWSERQ